MFLFFACLAPAVAFGAITNVITKGAMGVTDFILSCGISGILYALFSGNPMTLVGPTGLTLAFTTALYRVTEARNWSFLAAYSWTGIWTALFLALFSIFHASDLMKHCTSFTDDCFNGLISCNFFYEALMYDIIHLQLA